MKNLSRRALAPALAVAALLALSACTTVPMQGSSSCCDKMSCCHGKTSCCGKQHGCCCHGGTVQGCPYDAKH